MRAALGRMSANVMRDQVDYWGFNGSYAILARLS